MKDLRAIIVILICQKKELGDIQLSIPVINNLIHKFVEYNYIITNKPDILLFAYVIFNRISIFISYK